MLIDEVGRILNDRAVGRLLQLDSLISILVHLNAIHQTAGETFLLRRPAIWHCHDALLLLVCRSQRLQSR